MVKFITPTECLIAQIEQNEKLSYICDTINNAIKTNFQLGKQFKINISIENGLNWEEQSFLRDVFKRFGWKVISSPNKNSEYVFVISEAN